MAVDSELTPPLRDVSTDPDTSVRAPQAARARMARAGQVAAAQLRRDQARGNGEDLSPVRRRWAPFLSFLVVGGLAAVVALPAYAELETPVAGPTVAPVTAGQSIEARGAEIAVARDGVSALQVKSSTPVHVNVRYTNNPNGVIQWPFSYFVPISDMFGEREAPCPGCSTSHAGTDFDANEGDAIQAVADGVVTKVNNEDNNGDGLYVNISHDINGLQFLSRYCHLEPGSITVQEGQVVKVTQIIGNVGISGASTGSHLHFELHVNGVAVDPFAWLTEHAG